MKVAVTGGTGFLGSRLMSRLLWDGHHVTALVRDASRLVPGPHRPDRVVVGDIRDPAAVQDAVRGCDVAVHLVSNFRTASDPPRVSREVNVEGTRNIVEAVESQGVPRLVHCSTIGVHGHVRETPATEDAPFNPGDVYQETKLEAEKLVRSRIGSGGPEIVIVRPCSIYGPGDLRMLKMFRMLADRKFVLLGSGDSNFHAVYIDDLVDGFLRAMTRPEAAGGTFILGGPGYLPLRDYIAEAARALGAPMPWIRLPYAPMYAAGAVCEAICVPLRIEPPLHRRRVRFFRNNRAFSIERARRVLDYDPMVDLADGMSRTVAWYREQGLLGSADSRSSGRDTGAASARGHLAGASPGGP